ncbi:MAG: hypothetical protein M1819_006973 [Sarea resinae]|nr:MAG: hypothetical protein M1819_006973 [Sarea resinae]
MNPYEADPAKVPDTDRYHDVPLYGRYLQRDDDFKPDPKYLNSTTPEAFEYWKGVLQMCDTTTRLYDVPDAGRDVFAVGSIIIKSDHLRARPDSKDYALVDANEMQAIACVREVLTGIQTPQIYFAGKIHGQDVLIQSRIPGVILEVAWDYLSSEQKASFKGQSRQLLLQMNAIKSPFSKPSYVEPDNDPVKHRHLRDLEYRLLFGPSESGLDEDLGLMHNDFNPSNIIVRDDRIVGVIDWEMAGYFGWDRAGKVHSLARVPKKEDFSQLDLSDDFLSNLVYWNDLYSICPFVKVE